MAKATDGPAGRATDRHVCTAGDPWAPGAGRAVHPDAAPDGEQEGGWPAGDSQAYRCPNCGLRFAVELPQ